MSDDNGGARTNKGFYDTLRKYANQSENDKVAKKPESNIKNKGASPGTEVNTKEDKKLKK